MTRALLTALLVASIVAAGGGAAAAPDASVVARYPAENGSMTETPVVTPDDVATAEQTRTANGGVGVEVTLTDAGAQSFADTLVDAGFTSENGTGNCPADGAERNDGGYCLLTVVDGDVVYAAGLAPTLAENVESGGFEDDPRLLLTTATEANATRLARAFGASPENATTARTQTATTDDSTATSAATTNTTGTNSPGFGVGAAVVAVALAAGALFRR
ncbi:homolog to protein-export membrane protein SecD [Halobacterium hubeiense]|uniref:Homolog to protein-export membrane protein SecD n=1 Tax=Halobacterium hubeiense TaxID=1407499 RepID=A0A0U5H436_9EURY|nr:hypothetical protein [Halobacterium hubeiense]CQH49415.1 homolog to protein-export membrane protein SecD [Halobacterium hubeiense]